MRTALAPDALNKEANYAFPLEGLPRSVAYRARLLDEAPEGMTLRCADGEGQTTLLLLPDEMPEISLMAAPITKSYTLTLRLGLNGADAQDIPVAVQLSKDPPPPRRRLFAPSPAQTWRMRAWIPPAIAARR